MPTIFKMATFEQRSYVQYDRTDPDLWLDFRVATGEEFDASIGPRGAGG